MLLDTLFGRLRGSNARQGALEREIKRRCREDIKYIKRFAKEEGFRHSIAGKVDYLRCVSLTANGSCSSYGMVSRAQIVQLTEEERFLLEIYIRDLNAFCSFLSLNLKALDGGEYLLLCSAKDDENMLAEKILLTVEELLGGVLSHIEARSVPIVSASKWVVFAPYLMERGL